MFVDFTCIAFLDILGQGFVTSKHFAVTHPPSPVEDCCIILCADDVFARGSASWCIPHGSMFLAHWGCTKIPLLELSSLADASLPPYFYQALLYRN